MNDGYLAHHGIKGMKWGVRRYRNYDGTLTDAGRKRYSLNRVDLVQRPLSNFPTAVLARKLSKKSAEHQLNSFDYDIKDKEGNKLGHLYLYKESPSSLNINWIDIKQKHRGQKYAQEVLNGVIDEARKQGYKQITLEVPDEDDSALHIYKKLGFKKTGGKISEVLNPMVLNLDQRRVFVSGSSKTEFKDSGYYRKQLPKEVRQKLDECMKQNANVLVGDAPGIDRQVQRYLNKYGYMNVDVYGPGTKVRYSANKKWKTNPIDAPEYEPYSKEWLAKKDIEMSNRATEGLAVILDEGSSATRRNINRLMNDNKKVKVYEISRDGRQKDRWIDYEQ